jgi:hypothetical protein
MVIVGCVLTAVFSAQVQLPAGLTYQNRGNYSEGIKEGNATVPVLDLLGMVVDGGDSAGPMAAQFRVAFFLPTGKDFSASGVAITVREARNRYFYWLDDVQPREGWNVGKLNQFSWRTDVVVKSLTHHTEGPLKMADLTAVVRLGSQTNDGVVRVAPAALYQTEAPKQVKEYAFAFQPNTEVRFDFSLYPQAGTALLCHKAGIAEKNFTEWLQCRTDGWTDGWKDLLITLYDTAGTKLTRKITFFHRRSFRE